MELMERLLVVWCPELLEQHEHGREARAFERVLEAVEEFSPRVDMVRPGICGVPTRGPSRYFGGDEALACLVAKALAGVTAGIGLADGLFGALLAARSSLGISPPLPVIVAPGGTREFLDGWPVGVLDRPELADLLGRLGIHTLGEFAGLPAQQVLARFGSDGAVCRAVAAGIEGELPGLRPLACTGRQRKDRDPEALVRQAGFFGLDAGAEARAARAVAAVQRFLHPEAVVRGRLQGGRGPAERARLVPWGEEGAGEARPKKDSSTAPWPGQVPSPSPVLVLSDLLPADLVDVGGNAVGVSARGMASAAPSRLSVAGDAWADVAGWAGPWPCDERWWSKPGRRRQARMQVVTSDGAAYLLVRRRRWWVEAVYD